MSRATSRMARFGAPALLAAGLLAGTVAAPAQGASTSLLYLCNSPTVGLRTSAVTISANLPASLPSSGPAVDVPVTVETQSQFLSGGALAGTTIDLVASRLRLGVAAPGGQPMATDVALSTARPDASGAATMQGTLALRSFGPVGTVTVDASTLILSLRASRNGQPVILEPTADERDLDGDPTTAEAWCKVAGPEDAVIDPSGAPTGGFYPEQPVRLGEVTVVGPGVTATWGVGGSISVPRLLRNRGSVSGEFVARSQLVLGVTPLPEGMATWAGELTLRAPRVRLLALGYLPVNADLSFVSTREAAFVADGSGGERFSASGKLRLDEARLFGAIPIVGLGTCQSKRASELLLTPGDATSLTRQFDGELPLSDLSGCGALNGLVSPLIAGSGAINLELTRR